jgi:hypothetical protein
MQLSKQWLLAMLLLLLLRLLQDMCAAGACIRLHAPEVVERSCCTAC